MSHKRSGKNTDSIRKYLTRQEAKKTALDDISVDETPDEKSMQPENKMAEVSNAELKTLIMGLEDRLDKKMDDRFDRLTEKFDKLSDKVESLEVDVECVKKAQTEDREHIDRLENEIAELRKSLLHTQTYSRKYHLLLYGVEGFESTPTICIERVRRFAIDNLKLDEHFAKKLVIRNAHRLQKRDDGSPTPIIVVFLYWAERDAFLRAGRNLAGTRMSVRTDLPPELKQKRGKLAHEAYRIRQDQKIQARVQEKGIDVWIETRPTSADRWQKLT